VCERGAAHQPPHAVGDQRHPLPAQPLQPCRERSPRLGHRQPPVVIVEFDGEAVRAQVQLQPQIGKQHHAQRHHRGGVGQRERGEPAVRDVERIEPHDVVRQRRGALKSQLRSHDARHDEHPEPRICRARCAPRERCQRAVFGGAEVGAQLLRMDAAGQPLLDFKVAPGEAVVGRDVLVHDGRSGNDVTPG
jgi:hypothetical protein